MRVRKELLCGMCIIVVIVLYTYKQEVITVEDYAISSGFGNDIERIFEDDIEYSIPYSIYDFKNQGENKSHIRTGKASNIGDTRGSRSLKSARVPLVGLQKVILIGESNAKLGIRQIVDILFSNPKMNDRSLLLVCKGKAKAILEFKVKGYASSADYIEGMVRQLNKSDFFLDEYSLLNTYVSLDADGRNLLFPYLELENNELKITGLAVFKEDKMINKLDLKDSRIVNVLRDKKSAGRATINTDTGEYKTYSAKVKRKVKCKKINDKYVFDIDLNIYANVIGGKEENKKFSKDSEKYTEELIKSEWQNHTKDFIYKMQNQYKTDMVQLGFIAASKYGKDTNIDWDKEISNSIINVNVNVKVKESKRGEY